MQNFFSSRRPHTANIIQQYEDSYCYRTVSCSSYCCTAMLATTAVLKFQTFFFWLKAKNLLMKSLTLSNTFPYLLNFSSTNSNLITNLAIYKENQATLTHLLSISLSHSLVLKFHYFASHKHISISFSISLTKSLFLDNTITTHLLHHTITPSYTYSLFPSIFRKCLYFSAYKHISISFFLFLTKSLLLERNITHYHYTKVILAATIISCIYYI